MPRIKPTLRNVVIFSILFQLFPLGLYFLGLMANPDPKTWAIYCMVAISEFVLIFFILSWKRKIEIEVIDEREIAIQLKVKSFMLNVSWTVMGFIFLIHLGFFIEMPVWSALTVICISGLVAEACANWYYRKI